MFSNDLVIQPSVVGRAWSPVQRYVEFLSPKSKAKVWRNAVMNDSSFRLKCPCSSVNYKTGSRNFYFFRFESYSWSSRVFNR